MKIFSAAQTREWDDCSIREQGIQSVDLMERAATACYVWLINNNLTNRPVKIFCGKGNNGGDGLALVRLLLGNNIPATAYILETGGPGSHDFQVNLQRLHHITNDIHYLQAEHFFPAIAETELVIDALFGTGLNKPLEGMAMQLVEHINKSGAPVVSIDIPSGLFCDKSTKGHSAIRATHTLSFQQVKLAFLMPENRTFTGEFHLLPIGLSQEFERSHESVYEMSTPALIKAINKPREKFAHKGNFGHAALLVGSYGMMGAAVLAARACMGSGTGKLTCIIPSCGYAIMQSSLPEAMCKVYGSEYLSGNPETLDYTATGAGPGFGMHQETGMMLKSILQNSKNPMVLDADALNMIAANKQLLTFLPKRSLITPHVKEFDRIFGEAGNDFNRLTTAIQQAHDLGIYMVLKGHYSAIITPNRKVFFNNTGNAGMAKAGMGDALTGLITGLMAQQYTLPEAAILGVYLHGLAGDIARAKHGEQAMQATDLINCLGEAWLSLENSQPG